MIFLKEPGTKINPRQIISVQRYKITSKYNTYHSTYHIEENKEFDNTKLNLYVNLQMYFNDNIV